MKSQDLKKFTLPDVPGVYFFKQGQKILYIGKATSLKDRVKSYFSKDILLSRGTRIVKMLEEANKVEFITTDSVLEALILEANEIKKHQPIYNAQAKDDKSYLYVTITKEDFPKVVVTRGSGDYGPYPHTSELREALKIVRKIFPYRDEKCLPVPVRKEGKLTGKPCFNAQIGLCPGPCAGWMSKNDYRKQIRKIKLFFEGKKPQLIRALEKEMSTFAKRREFEKADEIKKKIFALDHIQDIALIKQDITCQPVTSTSYRIEAYDIAHISGTNAVGVMTVIEAGELNKSQYRKFKIRTSKNDDTQNLKEVLSRRLGHPEWRLPNLIVVDGGQGQLNAAKAVLKKAGLDIDIVSVVKDDKHKAREILGIKGRTLDKAILLANTEAHRFAIGYHRKLRGKGFRI